MRAKAYIRFLRLAVVGLLGALAAGALAQPISNLVVTVGTTVTNSAGESWSYVLIGSPDYQLLPGKQFAVYAKAGNPTDAGSYVQKGTMFQQTDPNAINALLTTATALGENVVLLTNALAVLLHNIPAVANVTTPGQMVLLALQTAASDPATAQMLGLLAHQHPGLLLCLGQGFAEPITGTTTYEVREINPATGLASAEVVGRVTIVPGSPTILAAPGAPFQVVTNDPSDHLRIRLRWGTSDAYRRQALLSYGFDVWRMSYSQAQASNYLANPPTTAGQLLADPNITRINVAPVMATKDFSTSLGAGGANDPADRTTYFFSDSNGHPIGPMPDFAHAVTNILQAGGGYRQVISPRAVPAAYTNNPAFADGSQYYYFITACDVLGRDGYVSPGGLGTACRRIPPPAPTNVVVRNTYRVQSTGDQQFLTVTWAQDLATNDQVTQYWVYRWPDPTMVMTNDGNPASYCIGVVPLIPNSPTNYFQDNSASAPLTPGLTNYWYTVRAVSQEACPACDSLFSPNSMPAWAVLRQRSGPGAGAGQLLSSCGTPVVTYEGFTTPASSGSLNEFNLNYLLVCQRTDPGIAWVEFFATNQLGQVTTLGPMYFPPGGNTAQVSLTPPFSSGNVLTGVGCVAGSQYGMQSAVTSAGLSSVPTATQQGQVLFQAGQFMLTSLAVAGSPLVTPGPCYSPNSTTVYPDGTVRLQFPATSLPMLIQVQSNGVWINVGVAKADANGNYSVFYPACLLGPTPVFQGCQINLPGEGGCSQHVSAGSPGSPINPIQITIYNIPADAKEFRLYRTVDGGPKTLIAQGAVTNTDGLTTIVRNDDAMPPSAATLCYYVQFLDMHGNGGPMTFIDCRDVKPASLPRPVLAAPLLLGSADAPQVSLSWFCPTSGVSRFELLMQRADGGTPLGVSGSGVTVSTSFDPTISFVGLVHGRLTEVIRFDSALLTPLTGPNFGPGPQFLLPVTVLTNVPYVVSVAAMDSQGNCGPASASQKFVWGQTNQFTPVPWPARPLPKVTPFDDTAPPAGTIQPRVAAVLLTNLNTGALDGNYPVGIRIGDLAPVDAVGTDNPNIGTTNFFSYGIANVNGDTPAPPTPPPATPPAPKSTPAPKFKPNYASPTTYRTPAAVDPNSLIFQRLSNIPTRRGESLLPIVLYRQQVANASFPKVSGTLTQVSPLIERLAYGAQYQTNYNEVASSGVVYTVTIYDRLIAGGQENFGGLTGDFLYLRDQQPVILGASYQYFVVHMNAQREIEEIIPAGTVTLPTP